MSMQAKLRARGIFLLATFIALLVVIFMPVFPGQGGKQVNGLDYMDNLFNMISKGSSYFIKDSMKKSEKFAGKSFEAKVKQVDEKKTADVMKLLAANGISATANGTEVSMKGDLGQILKASLVDADAMFNNDEKPLVEKYGFSGKQAILIWHTMFGRISKDLTKQEKFDNAKPFADLQKKALEPAYNYFGVQAENWKDKIFLVVLSLAFYVFYTVWYGFGLMYLFEGLGLKIGH
jgi:hypothetical protein